MIGAALLVLGFGAAVLAGRKPWFLAPAVVCAVAGYLLSLGAPLPAWVGPYLGRDAAVVAVAQGVGIVAPGPRCLRLNQEDATAAGRVTRRGGAWALHPDGTGPRLDGLPPKPVDGSLAPH